MDDHKHKNTLFHSIHYGLSTIYSEKYALPGIDLLLTLTKMVFFCPGSLFMSLNSALLLMGPFSTLCSFNKVESLGTYFAHILGQLIKEKHYKAKKRAMNSSDNAVWLESPFDFQK